MYAVFPPILSEGKFSKLGWIQNGSLALLILEIGVMTTVSTFLPGEDSIVSAVSRKITQCSLWMEKYSNLLGRLTLTEIALPGTHNSRSHRPVSQVWIKCQTLSLSQQLQCGIRVLDLRIGQKSPGDYIICHDTWHTSYSLAQALKEVTEFIDKSSKEIVILDFHRFVNVGNKHSNYDYVQLKQQISAALVNYCVPLNCAGKTIWSQECRIVVAWNTNNPNPYMWPGVRQHWYQDADSPSKLYRCIRSDMQCPPSVGMWATCSFMKSTTPPSPMLHASIPP